MASSSSDRDAVSDPRDRVARSLGPRAGEEAEYWATLADWTDWSAWVPAPARDQVAAP